MFAKFYHHTDSYFSTCSYHLRTYFRGSRALLFLILLLLPSNLAIRNQFHVYCTLFSLAPTFETMYLPNFIFTLRNFKIINQYPRSKIISPSLTCCYIKKLIFFAVQSLHLGHICTYNSHNAITLPLFLLTPTIFLYSYFFSKIQTPPILSLFPDHNSLYLLPLTSTYQAPCPLHLTFCRLLFSPFLNAHALSHLFHENFPTSQLSDLTTNFY